jgi:hypothetical protein
VVGPDPVEKDLNDHSRNTRKPGKPDFRVFAILKRNFFIVTFRVFGLVDFQTCQKRLKTSKNTLFWAFSKPFWPFWLNTNSTVINITVRSWFHFSLKRPFRPFQNDPFTIQRIRSIYPAVKSENECKKSNLLLDIERHFDPISGPKNPVFCHFVRVNRQLGFRQKVVFGQKQTVWFFI